MNRCPCLLEQGSGNDGDVVMIRRRRVDDRQFAILNVLHVIQGHVRRQTHGAFFCEVGGEDFAHQEHDQAEVDQDDSRAFPGEFESDCVSGQKIRQQGADQRVSADEWEPAGNRQASRRRTPPEDPEGNPAEPGMKIVILHDNNIVVDLGPRAGEDEDHRHAQQHDREPEGSERLEDLLQRIIHGASPVNWTD